LGQLETEGKQYGDKYRQNQARIKELESEIPRLEQIVKKGDTLKREQNAQQKRLASAEARLSEIDRHVAEWEADGATRLKELEESLADDSALKEQQATVSALSLEIEGEEGLKSERETSQRSLVMGEARLAEIDRAKVEWEGEPPGTGLAAELAQINERLTAGDYEPEAQKALNKLEEQAKNLGYDPNQHQEATKRRDELAKAEERYQALGRAEAAVKPLENNLADLASQIADQEKNLKQLEVQYETSVAQLNSLTEGGLDLIAVEKETNQIREEQIVAHRKVATAQQNVSVLDKLEEQRVEIKAEQKEVRQRIRRLKLLETACGREGVQALLIERALPEIEDDANELLSRLTGGQMQIIFETQRKLKTSDRLAETLDIHIVDAAGERPYENFSGGEQFRVNFAIRLALSKILTRRAGARLQTLVIDEGFGSQDPEGRQRLIEAINIIQDDFERVLVITHIEEMQDVFPTRIQVEKGTSGSAISVV
jgi:exonuclease SbcC